MLPHIQHPIHHRMMQHEQRVKRRILNKTHMSAYAHRAMDNIVQTLEGVVLRPVVERAVRVQDPGLVAEGAVVVGHGEEVVQAGFEHVVAEVDLEGDEVVLRCCKGVAHVCWPA
jgi:hypothetical protein